MKLFDSLRILVLFTLAAPPAAQAQWVSQDAKAAAYSLTDVQFVDADHGYATGAIGTMIKTVDGGQNWTAVTSGIQPSLRNLFFVNPDSGYVVGNAGTMARTTDGGQSWTTITSFNNGNSLNGVWFRDFEHGFTTMGDIIYSTTDAGMTWDTAYKYTGTIPIFTFRSLHFPTPQVGYAVGGYSGSFGSITNIAKTIDGGHNWTLLNTPQQMGASMASAFPDSLTGYLQDIQSTLHKTTDGGQTWTIASATGIGSFYTMQFTSPTTGFGAGYASGPMMTTNGGQTWTSQYNGSNMTWSAMHFPTPNLGFVVGSTNSTGTNYILKYTGSATGREEEVKESLTLFPNPASGEVSITGFPAGKATLKLVNPLGQTVLVQSVAGTAQLYTEELASGIYMVQILTEKGTQVSRLVVE